MKGPNNHRLYPVLVSSDEDGQEDPTAQDEHEEDEDTADEDALHSNSNNLRPSQPEIRMEPNSIYERRKAQVMLERKWSARRQRARERQRSSEAVFKYSLWQRSVLSIGVGVVVGIALVAILLWNREERLSGACPYVRTYVCVSACTHASYRIRIMPALLHLFLRALYMYVCFSPLFVRICNAMLRTYCTYVCMSVHMCVHLD